MSKNIISHNIKYNTMYNILNIIVPLILTPYLSRTLGVEGIGIYSFSFTLANYFRRFSLLGMEKYGNRSIALLKDSPKKYGQEFWSIYCVQLCSSLFFTVAYFLYIYLFQNNNVPLILQGIYVLSGIFCVSWFYFGKEDFKKVLLVSGGYKFLYLILAYIFIKDFNDLNYYILLAASSYFIPDFVLSMLAFRHVPFYKPNIQKICTALKGSLFLFIPVIAVTVYKSMDKLMLGFFCETAIENGLYENSEKILHVPIALITSVSAVFMPRMTILYRDNRSEEALYYIEKTIKYVAIVSMGMAFGIAGIAPIFSVVYWGDSFSRCSELLILFAITIPFMGLAEVVRSLYIIPKKKDSYYINAVILGAVVNFIVNYVFIPLYGAVGAVIGTVFSEVTVCCYQLYKVRKEMNVLRYSNYFLTCLTPCIIMFFAITHLSKNFKYNIYELFTAISVGTIVYSILTLLYYYFYDKDELIFIKSYLNIK